MVTRQRLTVDLFDDGGTFAGLNGQHVLLGQHGMKDRIMVIANDRPTGAPLFRNHRGGDRSPLKSDLSW